MSNKTLCIPMFLRWLTRFLAVAMTFAFAMSFDAGIAEARKKRKRLRTPSYAQKKKERQERREKRRRAREKRMRKVNALAMARDNGWQLASVFEGKDIEGRSFRLADHVGKKTTDPRRAVVLVFFNSYENVSHREIHQLEKIDFEWHSVNVELVHVAIGEGQEETKAFADETRLMWRAIPDPEGSVADAFGILKAPGVVVLSQTGHIAYKSTKYGSDRYQEIRKALEKATGAKSPWADDDTTPLFLRKDQTLRFGRPPSTDGASARWQPLASMLGKAARGYVKMVGEETYEDYETGLREGRYELANVGPLMAYRAREKYKPLVTLERAGQASYHGIIFAKKGSGIASLEDLQGRTVALVSESSTSGGIYPFYELMKTKLVLGKDVDIVWLGSHSKVAQAVQRGEVDAGACFEGCRELQWPTPEVREERTTVLAKTQAIPGEMILIRKDLPENVERRLRRILLVGDAIATTFRQISIGERKISKVIPAQAERLTEVGDILAKVKDGLEAWRAEAAEKRRLNEVAMQQRQKQLQDALERRRAAGE